MNMGVKVGCSAVLCLCALACTMQANAAENKGALTFTLDNDVFTGSDNNYTNGLGVTWVSPDVSTYEDDRFVSKWSRFWSFLPFVGDEGYTTYAAWTLAQEMHTPDDITNPNPPEDDEPYAGVLYVDSLLYAKKDRWMHVWELKLGVVGSDSQAGNTQKDFHNLIGGDEPMGWHTQLPNEPVINVGYTVAHLAAAGRVGGSAEWRLVPVGTAGVGTYFTGVGAGVYGEIGWNLVDALGGAGLRNGFNAASTVGVGPVNGWSVAFFGGLGGYGVAHYLPLDGTVFHDSRSVNSEPFIGTGSLGVSVRHGGLALGFAATSFTDQFSEQQESAAFGTLSMSWDF